jgi:hypothetical protein
MSEAAIEWTAPRCSPASEVSQQDRGERRHRERRQQRAEEIHRAGGGADLRARNRILDRDHAD